MDRIGSRLGEHLAGGRFVHEIEGMTRADKIGSDQARIKGGIFVPDSILPDW